MSDVITCKICGTVSPSGTSECPKCGATLRVLSQTVLVPQDDDELSPFLQGNRRAYFGRNMKMALYIMETDTRLECTFDQYMTIGRDQTVIDNHMDLSRHNAAQLGVSRRHARFIRSNATVMIEDLGTLNGTYLNGEKLSPGHPHVVCDGDELRLGAMLMAIIFQRPEKV